MKRMLINATHSEEIRVALADGQKLYNLDIDVPGQDRKKGNIYKGKITRVEPSLEAAFVDYGANRHGFLPYKEISRNYYTEAANKAKERPPIAKAIKEGTEVIIQVNKEERGNKGAAISTYISLAGRYMVYMPENPKAGGISRRIEGKARQQLKETLSNITLPKNSGIIVRTAGIGRTTEEILWDLNYLDQVWTAIKTAATVHKAPHFLYQESDIFIRALRDYLRPDVSEILIDDQKTYEKARDFMQQVMPHNLKKLSFYNDNIPLFSRYQIESQIQSAFSREVQLPSGGSLVIDHTEALISIDINSARATKGSDIEETALNTNLEAADEIARQMRIRDLGGLVVIDFIDMRNHKNQRLVEQQLNEAISNDRARVQTSKISRFGLLEMSRQRLKSSINESSQFACPRCSGHGFIRNIESLSVSILRILEEEALKPETGKVIVQVPTKVANFIINEKREELNNLENRHAVPMLIVANEYYQSPQFDVKRIKKSEMSQFELNDIQLNKPESEEQAENKSSQKHMQKREHAAVDLLVPESQAPERPNNNNSIVGWLKSLFSPSSQNNKAETDPKKPTIRHATHKNNKQGAKQPYKQQATKTHTKKTTGNKHNNKNHNKPHNKAQNKKQLPKNNKPTTNKQPHNKGQNNKPQKTPVHKDQKADAHKDQKPAVQNEQHKNQPNKQQKVDDTNGQMLQRPLGSVASYAANKAKQKPAVNNNATDANVKSGKPQPHAKKPKTQQSTENINKKNQSTDKDQAPQKQKTPNKIVKSDDVKTQQDTKNTSTKPVDSKKPVQKAETVEDKNHVIDDKKSVTKSNDSQTSKAKANSSTDKVMSSDEKKTTTGASKAQDKAPGKKDDKSPTAKVNTKDTVNKTDTDQKANDKTTAKKNDVEKSSKAKTSEPKKNDEVKQSNKTASTTNKKDSVPESNDNTKKDNAPANEKSTAPKQQKKVAAKKTTKDDGSDKTVKKTAVKKTAVKKKSTKKTTDKTESDAEKTEKKASNHPSEGASTKVTKTVKTKSSDSKATDDNKKTADKTGAQESKSKENTKTAEKPAEKTKKDQPSSSKGKDVESPSEKKSKTKPKTTTKKTAKKATAKSKKTLADANQQQIDFDI